MSKQVNGIDLLLLFSTNHIKIELKDGGIALATTDVVRENIKDAEKLIESFLFHADQFKVDIEDVDNDQDGQNI
jgi:hypothetical protein